MDERAREAARIGDIEALYALIREKPDVLSEIEQREFYDTPLHVAAAAGQTEFVMEFMGLKPSLAKKLNQDGLSPLHLAFKYEKVETARSLFESDKDLVRVKGKNGYTPFHFAVTMGDCFVLTKILKDCPECIHDVTNRKDTALHLAAREKKFEAFQALLSSLWSSVSSTVQIKKLLNSKNRNGDTVLHIAASEKQPKILKLLTKCRIDLRATNSNKLTAVDIISQAENQQQSKECLRILRCAQSKSIFWSIPWCIFDMVSQLAYEARNMTGDKSNALLVVTVLILTATYEAALSPPGGVFQANSEDNDTSTAMEVHSGLRNTSTGRLHKFLTKGKSTSGSSVLSTTEFLWFFIPNIGAFCISFIVTCFVLISNLTAFFWSALVVALSMLLFCLLVSAVMVISPNTESADIMYHYVYILAYFLAGLMYIIILVVVLVRLYCKILNKRHARQKP
ncbi:hypothetical protein like AT4G10720 [Hibiscus trionum]|uniref:PGG domain-containing protein n=1 Tax=Hibiscus trionum TaxID=183268 RepID=A0A9W7I0K0_HIBTR|nr:hypothetical protein like AT4G10720 [Hibiscus trionum]